MVQDHSTREISRFLSKVLVDRSGCLLWTASKTTNGYGLFASKRTKVAHRWVYEHVRGPIPKGLELDHLCRVRHCVNPWHLEAVTHRENILRGDPPMASQARQSHCKRGHAFTPENTYTYTNKSGSHRKCRTCDSGRWLAGKYGENARRECKW